MKIILLQDVKGLGKKDSIHEVSDGYAVNFLFPRGLAQEANKNNMNLLNNKKGSEDRKKAQEVSAAEELANLLSKMELLIKTKAGEHGRLFGSITSKDISEKLKVLHNLDIDKRKIDLTEPIKTVGNYLVSIKIYAGVNAKLKVKVEAE